MFFFSVVQEGKMIFFLMCYRFKNISVHCNYMLSLENMANLQALSNNAMTLKNAMNSVPLRYGHRH